MGEVVAIRSTEDALSLVKDWQLECQHAEEKAAIYELLYEAYRLQLAVAQREIERLRSLVA